MQTITEPQIKTIAKETAALSKTNSPINHSSMLEVISKALGFRDYNGLSASLKDNPTSTESATSVKELFLSHSDMVDIAQKKKERLNEEYPEINNKILVPYETKEKHSLFIHGEYSGGIWDVDIMARLNNSSTKRVYYSLKYDALILFVYPDTKTAFDTYPIQLKGIADINLFEEYFAILEHLMHTKRWMGDDFSRDLMALMRWITSNRGKMKRYWKKIDQKELNSLHKEPSI